MKLNKEQKEKVMQQAITNTTNDFYEIVSRVNSEGIIWIPNETSSTINITYRNSFPTKEDFVPIRIIYNPPYTICYFKDGERIKVKCTENDPYDREEGVAACIIRKLFGSRGKFIKLVKSGHEIKPKEE